MVTGDLEAGARGGGSDLPAGLRETANVLVLSDGMDSDSRGSYYDSLLPRPPSELRVLAVEYTRGPDGWLDEWRRHVGTPPAATAVVSVNDGARSVAATAGGGASARAGNRAISTVEAPDDLTGLGITIGDHLSAWSGTTETTLVTLDSLTVLLQYVDLKRAFRFLHVMANRVKMADAVGHYHMDPAAHDDKTVATLTSVFDGVARHRDGEWELTTR